MNLSPPLEGRRRSKPLARVGRCVHQTLQEAYDGTVQLISLLQVERVKASQPLDEADAVGHVERILVGDETDESLLLAIRADKRVDLGSRVPR